MKNPNFRVIIYHEIMNEDIMPEPIIVNDKDKVVTPTDQTPQDPKADDVKAPAIDIEAIIAAVTKNIEEKQKKVSEPKVTEPKVVESDDELFDKRFQAYEKKKFIASLDAESKKSLDGLPAYDTLSVEQLSWILNKVKAVTGVEPKAKTFPSIGNDAPTGTTIIDKDEYVKRFKEAEKKMRGGK